MTATVQVCPNCGSRNIEKRKDDGKTIRFECKEHDCTCVFEKDDVCLTCHNFEWECYCDFDAEVADYLAATYTSPY